MNSNLPTVRVIGVDVFRAWFSQLSSSLPVSIAVKNTQVLANHCRELREQLRKIPMPKAIDIALRRQLFALCQQGAVSVRLSANLEGGQSVATTTVREPFLSVLGIDAVIARVIDCFVSLWEEGAVKYRSEHGIDPTAISLAVVVQKMPD